MAKISVVASNAAIHGLQREIEVPYKLPFAGVPVLESFDFGFYHENELWNFGVLPGGQVQQFRRDAGSLDTSVADDRLYLSFSDSTHGGGDVLYDPFQAEVSHTVLDDSVAERYRIRVADCEGGRYVVNLRELLYGGQKGPWPPLGTAVSGVFLALAGFQLQFPHGNDYDVESLGVLIDDDRLTVTMRTASEESSDQQKFHFIVDVVVVSPVGMSVRRGEFSGRDEWHTHGDLPSVRGELLLTGFIFNRDRADEITRVAVVHVGDQIHVRFKRRTDEYGPSLRWRVGWALVGPIVRA